MQGPTIRLGDGADDLAAGGLGALAASTRSAFVDELRARIQGGRYEPPLEDVAEALLAWATPAGRA